MKPGDMVQHRFLHGPVMFVEEIYPISSPYNYHRAQVFWFDADNTPQGRIFPLAHLEIAGKERCRVIVEEP